MGVLRTLMALLVVIIGSHSMASDSNKDKKKRTKIVTSVWLGNSGGNYDFKDPAEDLFKIYPEARNASAKSGIEIDDKTPEGPRDALRHALGVLFAMDKLGPVGPAAIELMNLLELIEAELSDSDEEKSQHFNDVLNNINAAKIYQESGGDLAVALAKVLIAIRNSMKPPYKEEFVWNNLKRLAPDDKTWATKTLKELESFVGNEDYESAVLVLEEEWSSFSPSPIDNSPVNSSSGTSNSNQSSQPTSSNGRSSSAASSHALDRADTILDRHFNQSSSQPQVDDEPDPPQPDPNSTSDPEPGGNKANGPGCTGNACNIFLDRLAPPNGDSSSEPTLAALLMNRHFFNEWLIEQSNKYTNPTVISDDGRDYQVDWQKLKQLGNSENLPAAILATSDTDGEYTERMLLYLLGKRSVDRQQHTFQEKWTDPHRDDGLLIDKKSLFLDRVQ